MISNPLVKFFRQPAIYIRLPSGGKGWEPGSIDMPPNGEIPVLPMTAIDEITYRTPDALFNGEAVVSVIQSCIPNIKNAWSVPSIDLDTILVAIRIASSGHTLDIGSQCPACQEEHDFEMDLRNILDQVRTPAYDKELVQGDLKFYFRPLSYKEITENSLMQFENQRLIQAMDGIDENEPNRVQKINQVMQKLVSLTVSAMSQSIIEIRTGDAIVSDRGYIEEFLNNCDRSVFNTVKDYVVKLREESEIKPLSIKCPGCGHEYKQEFTLDLANFFVSAS